MPLAFRRVPFTVSARLRLAPNREAVPSVAAVTQHPSTRGDQSQKLEWQKVLENQICHDGDIVFLANLTVTYDRGKQRMQPLRG
jgi:hypothetical protein